MKTSNSQKLVFAYVNSRELNLTAEQSNIKLLADKQKTITTFVHVVNNKRTLNLLQCLESTQEKGTEEVVQLRLRRIDLQLHKAKDFIFPFTQDSVHTPSISHCLATNS
jgi:hypothetical protein